MVWFFSPLGNLFVGASPSLPSFYCCSLTLHLEQIFISIFSVHSILTLVFWRSDALSVSLCLSLSLSLSLVLAQSLRSYFPTCLYFPFSIFFFFVVVVVVAAVVVVVVFCCCCCSFCPLYGRFSALMTRCNIASNPSSKCISSKNHRAFIPKYCND